MYYKFVRIHKTLRTTQAMAAGVTDKLWEIGDVVKVLEDWETIGERNATAIAQNRLRNVRWDD